MKKIFLISAILWVAVGCKHGPVLVTKNPGPVQYPAGWQVAESSDKQVSMGIAPGWRRGAPGAMNMIDIGTSGMGTEDMSSEGVNRLEKMQQEEDAKAAAELEKKGIIISCIDSSKPIPGEARTQYKVKREKKGPMSLEDATAAAKEGEYGASAPTYVEMPIGKVGCLHITNNLKDGGVVTKIIYVVCNGEDIYTIYFITENAPSTIESIADPVMQSLRITPAKA